MNANLFLTVFSPNASLRYFRLWFVIGCLLILGIDFSSLTSSLWVPMPGNTDKVYHAASYGLLMLWWLQLFPLWSARVILALMFIAMGISLEIIQSFNPMRYLDYWDMAANSAGVLIAFVMGLAKLDWLLCWVEERMFK